MSLVQTISFSLIVVLMTGFANETNGQFRLQSRNSQNHQQSKAYQNHEHSPERSAPNLSVQRQRHWKLNNGKEIHHVVRPPVDEKHKHYSQQFVDPLLILRLQRQLAIDSLHSRRRIGSAFGPPAWVSSQSTYNQSFGNNNRSTIGVANSQTEANKVDATQRHQQSRAGVRSKSRLIQSPFASFSDGTKN